MRKQSSHKDILEYDESHWSTDKAKKGSKGQEEGLQPAQGKAGQAKNWGKNTKKG